LRYVTASGPCIQRIRCGKSFRYRGPDGRALRDQKHLSRIRLLAIPPAWDSVWICPSPNGHLQATGRDARGRKQYRYHPDYRATRDQAKFSRMIAFGAVLARIRKRVDHDIRRRGLPREKVLATVVRLLETTCIRVGNDEYARNNHSFGLTTLRDRHVEIDGATIRFEFRGKSGKTHSCDVTDARLARIVRRCQAIPGEELFQYLDEDGNRQSIGSGDVNDYLRDISGEEFTAKDFRTWAGTVLAVEALTELGAGEDAKARKSNLLEAIDRVAAQLNNTRAVCRKYYIHPLIFDAYEAGYLPVPSCNGRNGRNGGSAGLEPLEKAVAALLRNGLARAA